MAVAAVQTRYRFRTDTNAVNGTPTWGAAENTTYVPTPQRGTAYRLRFEIQNTGTTSTGAQAWRLFVSRNSGAYAQATTTGTYVKCTDASAGASADNASLTTRQLTVDSGTWVNGQYDTTGATGNITLTAASVTEIEFGIVFTSAVVKGDTYDFRVYRGTSTALNTYTQTPRVTITNTTLAVDYGSYNLYLPISLNDYTLSVAQGSYALTGQAATLTKSGGSSTYTLAVATGSYALTGQAAALKAGRQITAAQGSYALTGQAAVLRAGRKLTVAQGSYSLTGQAAALKAGRKLTVAQGAYTLNGQPATFGVAVPAAQGSYTLTGQSVAFKVDRKLPVSVGSYTLSGQPVTLSKTGSYSIVAGGGSYSLTGGAAALSAQRKITATQGAYTLTGEASNLVAARSLSAGYGSITITGEPAGLTYSPHVGYTLTAGSGYYALSGSDAVLTAPVVAPAPQPTQSGGAGSPVPVGTRSPSRFSGAIRESWRELERIQEQERQDKARKVKTPPKARQVVGLLREVGASEFELARTKELMAKARESELREALMVIEARLIELRDMMQQEEDAIIALLLAA